MLRVQTLSETVEKDSWLKACLFSDLSEGSQRRLSKVSCETHVIHLIRVVVCDVVFCLQKRQREFEDYIKDKYITAKADFRTLLKETKFITYRSVHSQKHTKHTLCSCTYRDSTLLYNVNIYV